MEDFGEKWNQNATTFAFQHYAYQRETTTQSPTNSYYLFQLSPSFQKVKYTTAVLKKSSNFSRKNENLNRVKFKQTKPNTRLPLLQTIDKKFETTSNTQIRKLEKQKKIPTINKTFLLLTSVGVSGT